MMVNEDNIGVKARTVLWYLTFVGFAVNYMIRINASISIVDMIDGNFKRSSNASNDLISECILNETLSVITNGSSVDEFIVTISPLPQPIKHMSVERKLLDYFEIDYEKDGFKWDTHKQGLVLGAFYWLNWFTQLPGGILANKYGTKLVFGLSNVASCVLCLLMPIASYLDYRLMVALRLIQGFIAGISWPAMNHITGAWIPPNERSKFITAYMGSSIGTAVTYPLFGFIMKETSWEYVFHFCGIFGIVWYAFWLYFVYDTPEQHPRIHPKEKEYILQSLGTQGGVKNSNKKNDQQIPWTKMIFNRALWVNTIAQWGGIWSLFTLLTQAPTYFRFIHGWGIEMTGLLSGLPHLLRVGFSLIVSTIGDYIITNDKMSRTNVRKLAGFLALIVNSFCIFGLAYSGCNLTMAIIFFTLALTFHGAVTTAALANIVDNAPKYAGITLGLISTPTICAGFVSPVLVGYLTFENQNIDSWKLIFQICGVMLMVCGSVYVLFNDSEVQSYNNYNGDSKESVPFKRQFVNVEENVKETQLKFIN